MMRGLMRLATRISRLMCVKNYNRHPLYKRYYAAYYINPITPTDDYITIKHDYINPTDKRDKAKRAKRTINPVRRTHKITTQDRTTKHAT